MKKTPNAILRKINLLILKNLLIFSFIFFTPLIQINADELVLASVGITVSPNTICVGESAYLDWSSTDATDISINPNIGSVSPYGNQTVSPSSTTTYTINGSNSTGGFGTANVTLTVNSCQNTPPPYTPPYTPPNPYVSNMPVYSSNISSNTNQIENNPSININTPSSSNSSVVINNPVQNPTSGGSGQNNYQINTPAPTSQNNYYQPPISYQPYPYQYNYQQYPQQYIQYPYSNYQQPNTVPNYPTPAPQTQTVEKIVKVYPKQNSGAQQAANLVFFSPIKNLKNNNSFMPSGLMIILFIIFIVLLFMLLMRNMSNRKLIINRHFDNLDF